MSADAASGRQSGGSGRFSERCPPAMAIPAQKRKALPDAAAARVMAVCVFARVMAVCVV